MKVIILVPNYPQLYREDMIEPLGALYLVASLQAAGVEAKVSTWQSWLETQEYADWYGLSLTTPAMNWAQGAVKAIREIQPNSKVIVGGPHVTFRAIETQELLKPDALVVGEGENKLIGLLSGTAYDIPVDLDALPIPNHRRLQPHFPNWWSDRPGGSIMCSRGCPRSCSFCGPSVGKRVRWRDPTLVAAEILKSGLKQWRFNDDDLLMREDYLEELVFYLKRLDIEFRCSAHVQSVKLRKLELLRDAGCKQIGYGVETGSQKLLDIHKDGCSVELSTRAIELTKKAGLIAQAYMIAGLPGETQETAQETIDWLEETQPDRVTMSTCVPYPGSDLFENPSKYGITWLDPDYSHYMQLGADDKPLTFDTVWADRYELASIRDTLRKAADCD